MIAERITDKQRLDLIDIGVKNSPPVKVEVFDGPKLNKSSSLIHGFGIDSFQIPLDHCFVQLG